MHVITGQIDISLACVYPAKIWASININSINNERLINTFSNATSMAHSQVLPGSVFINHSQEHSLSFSLRFANWNVT